MAPEVAAENAISAAASRARWRTRGVGPGAAWATCVTGVMLIGSTPRGTRLLPDGTGVEERRTARPLPAPSWGISVVEVRLLVPGKVPQMPTGSGPETSPYDVPL